MESAHDRHRDSWLQAEGYLVLRFWNHDVLARTDAVLAQILEVLASIRPLPVFGHLPPQAGEGKIRGEGS
jgi:very-short-patch-repair endonuclease